ncbi:uncharacterized protein PITG_09307 [Phytophthora infestans T30-4]|uniref:Uncharacterized protein n=1 Tax=Phytophthora infestans (strain T30-4) TaxID=403677 RepID=D0NBD8_PHYIT|nr:uncharacterized protein PITG_09307 [Phytophthora infestans T30-4]EEY55367.1 conserved hypothetical protein [Phytophthora infestans T30-4]|eukprot:XP_002903591.1 conserved hypothetical protein [Phytophthora infestans T30-4]
MKAAVISPALSIWWKVGAISGASAVLLGAGFRCSWTQEPREEPASAQELGDGSALPVDPLGSAASHAHVSTTGTSGRSHHDWHDALLRLAVRPDAHAAEEARHDNGA